MYVNSDRSNSGSGTCGGSSKPLDERSSHMAALAKQVGEILDFVLKFDEIKMTKPALQNDFSFYRRVMPRRTMEELIISDEEANSISLFLAEHIPMMKILVKVVSNQVRNDESVLTVIAAMANGCASMVSTKRFAGVETNVFCLRAMAGAVVLFDHVDLIGGAFRRKSPINIKRCCTLLCKSEYEVKSATAAVRYSTIHFTDEDTDEAIKELFD